MPFTPSVSFFDIVNYNIKKPDNILTISITICNADCPSAECDNAECHYAECHYAECHYAECHYAECYYAECRYAECRGAIPNMENTFLNERACF